MSREVKELHGYHCQVCGVALELPHGQAFAEAAHIRPLGLPHNGPDERANILCLCPNDHVRFDHGALYVDEMLFVIETATGKPLKRLRRVQGHDPSAEHLSYHRERWAL